MLVQNSTLADIALSLSKLDGEGPTNAAVHLTVSLCFPAGQCRYKLAAVNATCAATSNGLAGALEVSPVFFWCHDIRPMHRERHGQRNNVPVYTCMYTTLPWVLLC